MGTSHNLSVTTNNHALTGVAAYADLTARDADSDFNTSSTNINKLVRVEDSDGSGTIGYFFLTSTAPTWSGFGVASGSINNLDDVTITSAAANQILIYNAAASALENKTLSGDATLAADGTFTIASNFATSTDNLSFFSATTSAQLAALISDETGSGSLVFGTSPTIGTPAIVDFTNSTHDHADTAGGGTLLSTDVLSDTANIAYLNTSNTYSASTTQDFSDSTIANVGVIDVSGTSTVAGTRIFSDGSTQSEAAIKSGFDWKISTALSTGSFSVASQENNPQAIFFKPDGLRMYVAGFQKSTLFQYDLTTAWDLTTAGYASISFSLGSQDTLPSEIFFKSDGLKLYVVGGQHGSVYEYDLGTAWTLSTLVFTQSFSVSSEDNSPGGLFFKPNGLEMYTSGVQTDSVRQYDLSVAWDVSTAVYSGISYSTAGQDGSAGGIFFKPNGQSLYVLGRDNDHIFDHNLTIPWDLSTAVYTGTSFYIGNEDGLAHGFFIEPDGSKMYVMGTENDSVQEYSLGISVEGNVGIGTFAPGTPLQVNTHLSDIAPLLTLETTGGNGASARTFVGTRNPEGLVTAHPGDEYRRVNGTSSGDWIYKGVAAGNVGWVDSSDENLGGNVTTSDILTAGQLLVGNGTIDISTVPDFKFVGDTLTLEGGTFLQNSKDSFVAGTVADGVNLNTARAIFAQGNYVYATGQGANSFNIIDVSDPSSPSIVSTLIDNTNFIAPRGMYISGNYVYLAGSAADAFNIIDITDKTSPTLIATIIDSDNLNGIVDIFISGQYAYVGAFSDSSISIIDISDKTNPFIKSTLVDGGFNGIGAIHIDGNRAYVTAQNSDSMSIIDISDPDSPSVLGTYSDANTDGAAGITVSGRYAYVTAAATNTLIIVDVIDPTAPVLKGSLTDNTDLISPIGIFLSGNYVYIAATNSSSLTIIDVSDPSAPVLTDTVSVAAIARDVHVVGKYAYVISQAGGTMSVVDISGIDIPAANVGSIMAGTISTSEDVIVGNELYVNSGLNVSGSSLIFGDAAIGGVLKIEGNTAVSVTDEIVHITTSAKFTDQATASVIAIVANQDLINHFQITPITDTIFTQTGINSNLRLTEEGFDNFVVCTNTGTLFTGANAGGLNVELVGLLSVAGGTLFDFTGTSKGNDVSRIILFKSIISGWKLGTIGRDSTAEFGPVLDADAGAFVNWTDTLTFDTGVLNVNKFLIDQPLGVSANKPVFNIINTAHKQSQASFRDLFGNLLAGESLVRVDAGIPNDQRVLLTGNLINLNAGASLFDTSGSTGAYTGIANNSVSATAITGVTDSGGVASFTHAALVTFPVGLTVEISGFTTNTDYNAIGRVTASSATAFEVDFIAFGSDEAGSFLSNGVTITATAHGLSDGTGVTLDSTNVTFYDGGFIIYNVQTDSFDVAIAFDGDGPGTWSTKGLDQTDPRVLASGNPGTVDSQYIAYGFLNGGTGVTFSSVAGYLAIVLGSSGGFVFTDQEATQRWKYLGDGKYEYIAPEPRTQRVWSEFTFLKSSSVLITYRVTVMKNGVFPTEGSEPFGYTEIVATNEATNASFEAVISFVKGDTVQFITANTSGVGALITFQNFAITIS